MLVDSPLIADRYQLIDRLGAGSMGEVWKARDLRFGISPRFVALKLLKEDVTRRDDATNREWLRRALSDESSRPLTVASGSDLLQDVLQAGDDADGVRTRVQAIAAAAGEVRPDDVLALFDELVENPSVCKNARMRVKVRRLFEHEANSVANLRHENIAGISDYGEHKGTLFLAMDYIEGQTLQRLIQRGGLDRLRQLRLMEDLCAGLAYAHRRHLVHRDVKPANLIIDHESQSLKILDFGVVRRLEDTGESTAGIPIGTLSYMSPEQIVGSASVDSRSDVFSVGAVFYELLTGRRAFPPGEGFTDLVARIQRSAPQPVRDFVPDIDPAILAILDRALEKAPERRYQDLTEMQRDLSRVRSRLETEAEGRERTLVRSAGPTIVGDAEPLIPRLLRQGEQALEENGPTRALDCVTQILALDPGNERALSLQARANGVLRLRQVQLGLERGRPQLDAGNLAGARATWRELAAIDPASEDVEAFGAAVTQAEAEREETRLLANREADQEAARARERLETEMTQLLQRGDELMGANGIEAAIELLTPFRAWHPKVAARLTALKAERAEREWQAQEAQRERLEEEERQQQAEEREQLDSTEAGILQRAEELLLAGDEAEAEDLLASWQTQYPSVAARLESLQQDVTVRQQKVDDATRALVLKQPEEEKERRAWVETEPTEHRRSEAHQRQPKRGFGLIHWAAAGAVVLSIAAGVAYVNVKGRRAGDSATVPVPKVNVPPQTLPGNRRDNAPPTPSPAVVTIDILPWARVRIIGHDGATAPPQQFTTPFSVDLAPGTYTLRSENGGLTQPMDFDITVVAGEPQTVSRTMPGFNTDRIVNELLGPVP